MPRGVRKNLPIVDINFEDIRMVPIKNFEGRYSITDDGRVYSHLSSNFLRPSTTYGYHTVALSYLGQSKTFKTARLVAIHFLPNPNNLPVVNHIDFNRKNDHVGNLEWCTIQYNNSWTAKFGHMSDPHPERRLKIESIDKDGKTQNYVGIKETAKLLGIHWKCISNTIHGHQKTAGGYRWRFSDTTKLQVLKAELQKGEETK